MEDDIKNVKVIGGGLMGYGIDKVEEKKGNNVKIVEINEDEIKKERNRIESRMKRVEKKMYKEKKGEEEKFVKEKMRRLSN
jgi:3-hydroxyacyl-CoA dehydrogenase